MFSACAANLTASTLIDSSAPALACALLDLRLVAQGCFSQRGLAQNVSSVCMGRVYSACAKAEVGVHATIPPCIWVADAK